MYCLYRFMVAFLFYTVACVYAKDVKQYDIKEAILHKNDIKLQIPEQQQKHTILIIELVTTKSDIYSKSAISLDIWQEKDDKHIKDDKKEKQAKYKYLTLHNFITDKIQHINTKFGTLILKQDAGHKDSYIQIPENAPLQSAILLSHNERFYIIGFDNVYDVGAINEILPQDSKTSNIMQDTTYDISSWRYFLVLGIMIVILIVLYIIKLRQNIGTENSNIVLEQAKILDSKNKVALIRHGNKRYLIGLNPNGITLIDTLQCDAKSEQNANPQHKDTKAKSFMQLLLKRQ